MTRRIIDVLVGCVIGFLLAYDVVLARQIDMSKAGVSVWIFLAVGAFVILLQGIPVFLLVTGFLYNRFFTKEVK